jgi:DNA-binding transcriptional ArsR family regulator
MTAGEIASLFPDVSRASVSKHLKVLRDVRLVRAREHGREWHYRLEGQRFAAIEAWLQSFAPYWEESLARLKERAERD